MHRGARRQEDGAGTDRDRGQPARHAAAEDAIEPDGDEHDREQIREVDELGGAAEVLESRKVIVQQPEERRVVAERQDEHDDDHGKAETRGAPVARHETAQGEQGGRDPDEQRHLRQRPAAPVRRGDHVAEQPGEDERQDVLGRKRERRRDVEADAGAKALGRGLESGEELHRRKACASRIDRQERDRVADAPAHRDPAQEAIHRRDHRRVEDVLHMAGEDLDGDGGDAEDAPGRPPRTTHAGRRTGAIGIQDAVDCEKDERRPGQRGEAMQMAAVDLQEHRTREHEHEAGQDARSGMQTAVRRPAVDPERAQDEVRGDREIDRERRRQHHVHPVGWIQQRGSEPAEVRRTAVVVGIPQDEVAAPQLAEGEGKPVEEGPGHVVPGRRQDEPTPGEEHVAEDDEGRGDEDHAREDQRPAAGGFLRRWVAVPNLGTPFVAASACHTGVANVKDRQPRTTCIEDSP